MRKLACRLLGHENIWTLDPLSPTDFIVVCLRCRDRGYSAHLAPVSAHEGSEQR